MLPTNDRRVKGLNGKEQIDGMENAGRPQTTPNLKSLIHLEVVGVCKVSVGSSGKGSHDFSECVNKRWKRVGSPKGRNDMEASGIIGRGKVIL